MELSIRTFNLINEKRQLYGRPSLEYDEALYNLCYEHSYNCSIGRSRNHDGFEYRKSRIPFQYYSVAENVANNFNQIDPSLNAVSCWLQSYGHLQNIMGDYNVSGLAVVQSNNGVYYFTQIFAKR